MTCWLTIIGTSIILLWIGTSADARPGTNDGQIFPTDVPSIHEGDGQSSNTKTTNQELGSEKKNVCPTPECKYAASKIRERMNPTVKPCDNFYKFVCGGFLNSTEIPKDRRSVDIDYAIKKKVQEQLRTMMDAEIEENELKPFKLVKTLYKSCMDEAKIEARGVKPLREIFDKNGGWPVLYGDLWNETAFELRNLTYELRKTGQSIHHFSGFYVGVDPRNKTRRVIHISEPIIGRSRRHLIKGLNDIVVQDYYTYMVEFAELMGAEKEYAKKELMESLLFEIELAKIMLPPQEEYNLNEFYSEMSVKELIEKHPMVPWKDHLTRLLLSPGIDINNDTIVIEVIPGYIEKLENLMSNTTKRVQANYVMWQLADDSVNYLNDAIRKINLKAISGTSEPSPRWKDCIDLVRNDLGLSFSAMYVRRYANNETKPQVTAIITEIKREFKKILEKTGWLDSETRQAAVEKLSAMSSTVAYPDELLIDEKLLHYYQNLELSEDKYFENNLAIVLFETNRQFARLNSPVEKNSWTHHIHSTSVNAFAYLGLNNIDIPAATLQDDYFNVHVPKYMNYGAIGTVIGHEITHGFDDDGRQYDKNGAIKEWWTQTTKDSFRQRAKCVVYQYGNYTVDEVGVGLNGTNTLNENIADIGGVKIAYRAYINRADNNVQELALPELDYTPNQMFWISYANTWCRKYRLEALKDMIDGGSHSPSEFRIIGSLSNTEEFINDFDCPSGSTMNRTNKCSVW